LSRRKRKARTEEVSIMVNDQGSTVPKARGANIKTKIKSVKTLLAIR
jgi:hypothetical protein